MLICTIFSHVPTLTIILVVIVLNYLLGTAGWTHASSFSLNVLLNLGTALYLHVCHSASFSLRVVSVRVAIEYTETNFLVFNSMSATLKSFHGVFKNS